MAELTVLCIICISKRTYFYVCVAFAGTYILLTGTSVGFWRFE